MFQNITTRTAGGFQYREQVVDEQSLRSDVAYIDLLKANARGLMSQDIKQQKQFITGRLKWTSDTAKAYENATMEQREAFLIDQVLRKDLEAMGESREVTDEDVKNIPGLKKYIEKDGQKIPNRIYTKNIGKPTAVKPLTLSKTSKLTEGDYRRLNYKDKVEYLNTRFTPENVTFESALELANEEGIKVEQIYDKDSEELVELKLGNTIINKNDAPEIIKKKLLIAGGVKNKDAEELINEQSLLFQPNIGTGNLPIKK